MTKPPATLQMMDTSTGHLSPSTRDWLSRPETSKTHGFMERDTGFAISTWLGADGNWEDKPEIPRDLLHVLRYAHANSLDWVLFDVDAEQDMNLPWYEDTDGTPELPDSLGGDVLLPADDTGVRAVDPARVATASLRVTGDRQLEDEDYTIPDGEGAWIGIAGTSVRIKHQDWGVQITSFVNGYEMDEPLGILEINDEEIAEVRARLEAAGLDPAT